MGTLPDGAGTIQFHALDCPTKAGQIDVKLDLDLADSFANDLINIQLSALSSSGDKLLCMEIETNGVAAEARPDCSGAAPLPPVSAPTHLAPMRLMHALPTASALHPRIAP